MNVVNCLLVEMKVDFSSSSRRDMEGMRAQNELDFKNRISSFISKNTLRNSSSLAAYTYSLESHRRNSLGCDAEHLSYMRGKENVEKL